MQVGGNTHIKKEYLAASKNKLSPKSFEFLDAGACWGMGKGEFYLSRKKQFS
jgi:hypothetical protein